VSFHAACRTRCVRFLIAIALLLSAGLVSTVRAQKIVDRKVKTRVAPVYPEAARKMGLEGIVKIQVTIAPDGTIRETKVIGGHPILVNAALDAVKKWKFETAAAASTGTLEFKFSPPE
jgi:TonB family protein